MKAQDSRRAGKSLLRLILAIVVAAVAWFAQEKGLIKGDGDSGPSVAEAPADPGPNSTEGGIGGSGGNRSEPTGSSTPQATPSNSSSTTTPAATPSSTDEDSSPWGGKNDAKLVQQSQRYGRNGVPVELPVKVVHLLPDDTDETPHQNFLAETSLGQTLKISHNTKLAPYVPIKKGDFVRVKGDFETNSKGGVVHWTHWDPRGRHIPGWIEHNGKRYGKL